MFTDGKIKTYDSERGMGTLELVGEAQELSFKLQDLPSPEIEPQIGERLKFRIIPQQGSMALDNIVRLDINEPYRVCRRLNILRDYSDEKTNLYPRN